MVLGLKASGCCHWTTEAGVKSVNQGYMPAQNKQVTLNPKP